jgi:hypothetical protein
MDGEGGGDDGAVTEPELCPEPIAARQVEPEVEPELGTEPGAGDGEDRPTSVISGLGVPVLEGGAVGTHHHDVSGRADWWCYRALV